MIDFDWRLAAVTLVAAFVNGAIGYGLSSITVPVALLFMTGRILNPALVIVEVGANAYALLVNRRQVGATLPIVSPVVVGLPIGIAAGTMLLASLDAARMKLLTFAILAPLILVQGAGWRHPVRSLRAVGPALGLGVGALYSVTTISGPPLAVFLTNQGLTKGDFRAGMAGLRLVESSLAAVAYLVAGLFTWESLRLVPSIVPSLAVGIPLGALSMTRVPPEVFRRVCISLDAWLVGFGLATLLRGTVGIGPAAAYSVMTAVVATDAALLWRFARARLAA